MSHQSRKLHHFNGGLTSPKKILTGADAPALALAFPFGAALVGFSNAASDDSDDPLAADWFASGAYVK